MKKALVVTILLGVILLSAGCAKATPEERFLSHWEKIVNIMTTDRNDPSKALADVKAYLDKNLPEMKTLSGEFGMEESKLIAQDPNFINRVLKVVDKINELAKTNKSLLDDPQFADVYSTLSALNK